MNEERERELQLEIDSLREKLNKAIEFADKLKEDGKAVYEQLNQKFEHCSRLMKERDDLAFRLRKIQAAFEKVSIS